MPAHLSLYLDALRILAAVVVFLGHFSQGWLGGGLFWQAQPHGHTAVLVFFVISGYVIAFAADTRETTLSSYAIARASRILSVAVPALILSALLLLAGSTIDPVHYAGLEQRGRTHTQVPLVAQFLAGLFFVGESWGLHIRVLGNTPYWSLAYEVWYYILFGCLTFLHGKQRLIGVLLACLLAGPKILFMAPIWIAGTLAWRWRHHIPAAHALPLALLSAALFLALALLAPRLEHIPTSGPWWPMEFRGTDHLIGLVFALHIAAVGAIRHSGNLLPAGFGQQIKSLAGYSFSTYLYHYPLLVFFAAILPGPSTSPQNQLGLLLATTLSIIGLAQISEKKCAALKTLLTRKSSG